MFDLPAPSVKICFRWVCTVISILLFAWRWHEWMWGLKSLPWGKVEFYWSITCIVLLVIGGLIALINTGSKYDGTNVYNEGIAAGVITLCGMLYEGRKK